MTKNTKKEVALAQEIITRWDKANASNQTENIPTAQQYLDALLTIANHNTNMPDQSLSDLYTACKAYTELEYCGKKDEKLNEILNQKINDLSTQSEPQNESDRNKFAYCLSATNDPQHISQANKIYEEGAKNGNATSSFYLAQNLAKECYKNGNIESLKDVAEYYKKAASLPNPQGEEWTEEVRTRNKGLANAGAANCYLSILEKHNVTDWNKATEEEKNLRNEMMTQLQEGAGKHHECAFMLAKIYENGRYGVEQNKEKAAELYNFARTDLEKDQNLSANQDKKSFAAKAIEEALKKTNLHGITDMSDTSDSPTKAPITPSVADSTEHSR